MNAFPEVEERRLIEEQKELRARVPWEKIDEWIASLDPLDGMKKCRPGLNLGDRRN